MGATPATRTIMTKKTRTIIIIVSAFVVVAVLAIINIVVYVRDYKPLPCKYEDGVVMCPDPDLERARHDRLLRREYKRMSIEELERHIIECGTVLARLRESIDSDETIPEERFYEKRTYESITKDSLLIQEVLGQKIARRNKWRRNK